MKRSVLAFAVLSAACAGSSPDSSSTESSIVGGQLETRYPASGYLVARINSGPHAGETVSPVCGAALIANDAVITSAGCVEEQWTTDRTITGVGFGDLGGTVHEVDGGWKDWIHPSYLVTFPPQEPGGEPQTWPDARYGVAIVRLKQPVSSITPMPLASGAIAPKTSALAIGYGRVVGGDGGDGDRVSALPDNRAQYPGTRKSVEMTIPAVPRMSIDAYPRVDKSGTPGGGVCFGDFGGPLILDDGSLAGVLADFPRDVRDANLFDGVPLCRTETGGSYANLQFGKIPEFISLRLAP